MDNNIIVTQFYIPDNDLRKYELMYCLYENIKNTLINKIILVVNENEVPSDKIPIHDKIKILNLKERPTYRDLFEIGVNNLDGSEGLIMILNSDIFYKEEDIIKIKKRIGENEVFALSRWEFIDSKKPPIHHNTWDSQDSWIFKNKIFAGNYDIKLGIPGCDNKIAYELQKAGYLVKNPSISIKSYHFHNSNYRTYNQEDRIPEPYFLIIPEK